MIVSQWNTVTTVLESKALAKTGAVHQGQGQMSISGIMVQLRGPKDHSLLLQGQPRALVRGKAGITLSSGCRQILTALWEQGAAEIDHPARNAYFMLSVLIWTGLVLCSFTVSPCSWGEGSQKYLIYLPSSTYCFFLTAASSSVS